MHATALGKDVFAGEGLVSGDAHAAEGFDHARDLVELGLVEAVGDFQMVVHHAQNAGQRGVAGSFAQSVDGGVYPAYAGLEGDVHIGYRKVVVVVGMKIEMHPGVTIAHGLTGLPGLVGTENAEGVGQHDAFYFGFAEGIDHKKDVVAGAEHAVGPILEVNVDGDAAFFGFGQYALDVGQVLFGCFSELTLYVLERAFGQQVQDLATGGFYPVEGDLAVYKTEDFYFVETVVFGGPLGDALNGSEFPFRDPCRGHFEAVDFQLVEQEAGDGQLFGFAE